jgi:hypothetical protein
VFRLVEELLMIFSIEAPFTLLKKPIKVIFLDAIETS